MKTCDAFNKKQERKRATLMIQKLFNQCFFKIDFKSNYQQQFDFDKDNFVFVNFEIFFSTRSRSDERVLNLQQH
jgi:hypothetical protein